MKSSFDAPVFSSRLKGILNLPPRTRTASYCLKSA